MTDEIGVLLPLQLETTFLPPDDRVALWQMRLRIIPQPVSIDGHSDYASDEELRAVTAFRTALGRTDSLTTDWFGADEHRHAFAALARAVGPARAAWLATTISSTEVDGQIIASRPPDSPHDHPSRVRGLPARLQVGVWTYDVDGAEVLHPVGTLPEDGTVTIPSVLDLPDLSDRDAFFDHWVANWERARKVGLGGTFNLPDGLTPHTLGGVTVWGIGSEHPDVLVEHHVHSGVLAETVLGSATHSVEGHPTSLSTADAEGAPVPDGSPDVEAHWQAMLRRLNGTATSLDTLIEQFVTGRPMTSLARPIGRERLFDDLEVPETVRELFAPQDVDALMEARSVIPPETGLASLLLHALWPVLWGSFAHDEWDLPPETLGPLTRWALENVTPEGPLPTLRIGDDPYALLPITRLDTWRPAADEADLASAGLETLVTSARTLRRHLHAAVRPKGSVPGGDVDRYADLLLRGGASRTFGTRRSAPRQLVQAWLQNGGPWDLRDTQLAFLGLPDRVADPFVEVSAGPNALNLPLTRPRHWTYWGLDNVASRVPLPALIEIALGRRWTLAAPNTGPPLTLGQLFDPHAYYIDETGDTSGERPLGIAPDSLLVRLLLQAVFIANTWSNDPDSAELIHALGPGFSGEGSAISALQVALLLDPGDDSYDWRRPGSWPTDPNGWSEFQTPQGPMRHPEYTVSSCPQDVQRRLEQAFGAVLDTVSTRIDPWITAVAWKRLRTAATPAAPRRLGAYGWVHGPFHGVPGPTESGLIHTPSQAQTLVATLVRDDFRENQRTGVLNARGEVPSGIALTGAAVRFASAYVEDLRDGHHPYEIVGREVERIITAGASSPYEAAAALRRKFPWYPERPDPRQTCHGLHALAELIANPAGAPEVTVSEAQLRELAEVRAGLDALGDLALLDGALHGSSGRPSKASAALRGASGSAVVAMPEFPLTPSPGRELRTTVLAVLPWHEAADGDGAARLAEPSVAALLESQLGEAWTWQVRFEDDTTASVGLADLGLRPIDTLVFSPAQLRILAATAAGVRGVALGRPPATGPKDAEEFQVTLVTDENRTWEVWVGDVLHGTATPAGLGLAPRDLVNLPEPELAAAVLGEFFPAGIPDGAHLQPVPSIAPTVWSVRDRLDVVLGVFDATTLGWPLPDSPPEEHERLIRLAAGAPAAAVSDPPELARASRLCALLGEPATEQDLAIEGAEVVAPGAYDNLRSRYTDIHEDLSKTIEDLQHAHAPNAVEADQGAAIRRGALWGVTPDTTPADSATLAAVLSGTPIPERATSLGELSKVMATTLAERLAAAPAPAAVPSVDLHQLPLKDYSDLREGGLPDGVAGLARAMSALVAPQGGLPILPRWTRTTLTDLVHLEISPDSFEEDWLTVLAPVRTTLARVEAHQLDAQARGAARLATWASDPDPWRTAAVTEGVDDTTTRTPFGYRLDPFVAAYGPTGVLDEPQLAVGIIDSFSEVVPLPQRDTHAAFGFNAPAARAPQAILLAVQPNADEPLTDDELAPMLAELRELVVARSARMPDLIQRGGLLRTTWLPQDEPVSTLDPNAYLNPR